MTRKEIAQIMGKPQEYSGSKEFRYIESPMVKGQYIIRRPLGSIKELLGISVREYTELLLQNGGYATTENKNVIRLKTIEEAQVIIDLLNSLFVLHKMIKE